MDELNSFIEPELLVLIPVLNFAGWGLKRSQRVSNNIIPAVLGGLGSVLAGCYEMAVGGLKGEGNLWGIVFGAVTQGMLCAASAVYLHELYHQQNATKQSEAAPDAVLTQGEK